MRDRRASPTLFFLSFFNQAAVVSEGLQEEEEEVWLESRREMVASRINEGRR